MKSSQAFKKVNYLLLFLSLFLWAESTSAQSGSEIYRHITSRDGLSNSFVWEMIQDKNGFIWIAGNNGLDRYDGYNTTSFRNDPNDESSITGGAAFSLLEDENGYVWVGTSLGLSIFDPANESFLQVRLPDTYPSLQGVQDIVQAEDSSIWTGSTAGLHRFSPQTPQSGTPEVDFFALDDSLESKPAIQTIEEGADDTIWLGTDLGVYIFDIETGERTKPGPFDESLDEVLNAPTWQIFKDKNNSMWISSELGFAVWRSGEAKPEHITAIGNGKFDLTNAYMQSIFEDRNGHLWLGTGEIGAFKYNPETDEAIQFLNEGGDQNSITEDDVHYVFEDVDGNVWFGYHNIGISVMYTQPWEYQFNRLTEADDPDHPLNDIHSVADDEAGNLWLATHQGLVLIPNDGSSLRSFLPDAQNNSPENVENQMAGFIFKEGQILAGSHANKFYIFDIESERFTRVDIPEDIQLSFANTENETHYYLGSFGGNELIEVNIEDYSVTVIEAPRRDPDNSENRAVIPMISPEGNIYIKFVYLEGQNFSWDFFLFDPADRTFTKSELQSPDGISIFRPPVISKIEEGVFWIITNLGILREDIVNNESRFLFQRDAGIVADSGNELFEDEEGFLWLGGVTGIVKLDPVTESLTMYEASLDRKPNFFRSPNQLRNGDIVYGGIGGYSRFNPNQQVEGPTIQNVHVTELRSGADIYNTLNSNSNYEIEYSNNNIAFTYLALNYRNPAVTRYRYRLAGYHDEWTEVGTQRSVFFANLPPGNYTFQVQAGQRFGSFNEATAELNVAVLPPWWRTIPAYIGFLMFFIGGVVVVDRVQRRRVIQKERERSREKELEQAKEIEKAYENLKAAQEQLVQQEKLASLGQLTAGIAHEIKNPLNFVNNFSDLSIELVEEAREEVKEKLSADSHQLTALLDDIETNLRKIHEHGSRADSIVKSMLQHSRGGNNKVEPTDLNALIKEYSNLAFHGMRAGKKPINVNIELDLDNEVGEIPLIAEDFSRVILNLCNNAFDAMREKLAAVSSQQPGDSPSEDPVPIPREGKGHNVVQGDISPNKYEPKLTIRTHQKPQSITIEIEDNGPGIPEEIKDKVLHPFFTTKKGTEGTGLGLSITNDIIKAHGGALKIHSKEEGTIMAVTLNKS